MSFLGVVMAVLTPWTIVVHFELLLVNCYENVLHGCLSAQQER